MMYLVQLLLPLADNHGRSFPDDLMRGIQRELSERFGGLTAYTRAPAKGIWIQSEGQLQEDIIVIEVMAQALERSWWEKFRQQLQKLLDQKQLVIRAQEIMTL